MPERQSARIRDETVQGQSRDGGEEYILSGEWVGFCIHFDLTDITTSHLPFILCWEGHENIFKKTACKDAWHNAQHPERAGYVKARKRKA